MSVQDVVFRWASHQQELTGVVLFAVGIAYAFFGFRLVNGLLAILAAAIGFGGGLAVSQFADSSISPLVPAGALAVVGAVAGFRWPKPWVPLSAALAWGVLGAYLFEQIRATTPIVAVVGFISAVLGLFFGMITPRAMTLILTTLVGTGLMIVGFVSVTAGIAPVLNGTFREMAGSYGMLVPVLMAMVFVAGYSYQSMQIQGDTVTGAT